MRSLVVGFSWPLLLQLLLLLPPPTLMLHENYWDYREYELDPELRDFLREYESTGPTKPPTVKRIIEKMIVGDRPLDTNEYCSYELKTKQVHYKGRCYPEHYIVGVSFGELTKACSGEKVQCKNSRKICRRSMYLVEGVHCVLESGERMANCSYKTVFMTGYPVVTCQWDEDLQIFIPNHIYDMVPPE